MPARVASFGAALGLLVAAVAGVFAGLALAERANTQHVETMTLAAPSSAEPRDVALRSAGGFTGFEAGALPGDVTRVGEMTEQSEGRYAVSDGQATLHVALTSAERLYTIQTATRGLEAGDVVVLQVGDDRTAEGALRIVAELPEEPEEPEAAE